MAVFQLEI